MNVDGGQDDDNDVVVIPVSNHHQSHARALIVDGGKTTGLTDDDLSNWEQLVHDLQWLESITLANIRAMKINEKVPIANCENTKKNQNLCHLFPHF